MRGCRLVLLLNKPSKKRRIEIKVVNIIMREELLEKLQALEPYKY
jgi:hypothetical protein